MSIDASIRITAIVDQAVKALRQVKAETVSAVEAGKSSGNPLQGMTDGANAATASTKKVRAAVDELADADRAAAVAAKAASAAKAAQAKADAKTAADAAKQQLADQKAAAAAAAKAVKDTAYQQRMLAPQLTDIVVGLTSGQSPFTVLMQQGGQLKDVFGGVGNALKAVGSIFTATRVLVGAFSGALALVATAAYEGARESDALNKTLALTGNIAGTSAGQLNSQARAISISMSQAIGDVRQTQAALLASGEFTATSFESAARAAVSLSKINGQSAAETVKSFDGMSDSISDWAAKANKAYNFLTVGQFKYIQSLQAQGRTQEAMKVTLDALNETIQGRSVTAVGLLERAWNGVKVVTAGVWDNLKGIGREKTPEDTLADLQARLDKLQSTKGTIALGDEPSYDNEADLTAKIDAQKRLIAATNKASADKAAAEAKTQKEIAQQEKGFQDSLAQITAAGLAQQLAVTLAGLDKRQSAVELANAKGLLNSQAYNLALNAIDQQRLAAQEKYLEQQIALESSKKVITPEDTNAQASAVKQLQAQLVSVRSQISQAAAKNITIASQAALDDAKDQADKFDSLWRGAIDQVRDLTNQNAASAAAAMADPVKAAAAAAEQQVADLRKKIADLNRDLNLQLQGVHPADGTDTALAVAQSQRDALLAQLKALGEAGGQAISEGLRSANFSELQKRFQDLTAIVQAQEDQEAELVSQGAATTVDAEKQKFDARAKALPQLQAIIDAMKAIATTPAEKAALLNASTDVLKLKDATSELAKTARTEGIQDFATMLTDIETGAKSGKSALLDMVSSFAKAMLDVLNKRLAEQLVDQFTSSASSASGGFLSLIGSGLKSLFGGSSSLSAGSSTLSTFAHTGAVIGVSGGWRQAVPSAAFASAPRYHLGGIAGLAPNEVPAILEQGEEVLTAADPRHSKNLKGGISVTNNVTITTDGGSDAEAQAQGRSLVGVVNAAIDKWAATQSRQGGMLSR